MLSDSDMPKGIDTVPSPALLVDPSIVQSNLQRMLAVVQNQPTRLRPHVKTHKMSTVVKRSVQAGIQKFKAATTAELAMVAKAGGTDCLLAYQPVGPRQNELLEIMKAFPKVRFSAVVDNTQTAEELNTLLVADKQELDVYIDVDCGMHRTGIPWGSGLEQLQHSLAELPALHYQGLHVYDGHLHQSALAERTDAAELILEEIQKALQRYPDSKVIAGGSPTFEFWAQQANQSPVEGRWECSPGTMVFWDRGYGSNYQDMDYGIAAVLLTRVISHPGERLICVDLGHKAVASEMALERRVYFPQLSAATFVGQSEEHLVLETDQAASLPVGTPLIALPTHICPTVALHRQAYLVEDGKVTGETWTVDARDR
ncbi:D-threonine aldolase [Roseimaritima multifibrata]|uniref:D-threonine aldolase n=1 Tax=Roseimaritima multifibrata TaxID=1930274 RepID=A0A517MAN7_9BACT|nr:D-TA family PLP-dependent enzyme [Roseimaritima multifibrata]QDS91944.1 D-threonine aldolase [Roseimaritima multifibrata]